MANMGFFSVSTKGIEKYHLVAGSIAAGNRIITAPGASQGIIKGTDKNDSAVFMYHKLSGTAPGTETVQGRFLRVTHPDGTTHGYFVKSFDAKASKIRLVSTLGFKIEQYKKMNITLFDSYPGSMFSEDNTFMCWPAVFGK